MNKSIHKKLDNAIQEKIAPHINNPENHPQIDEIVSSIRMNRKTFFTLRDERRQNIKSRYNDRGDILADELSAYQGIFIIVDNTLKNGEFKIRLTKKWGADTKEDLDFVEHELVKFCVSIIIVSILFFVIMVIL